MELFSEIFVGTLENKTALVQVMTWCCLGDKPLPYPIFAPVTDICHVSFGLNK